MDDFYHLERDSVNFSSFSISDTWKYILSAPFEFLVMILIGAFFAVLATRLLSGRSSEQVHGKDERTVWLLPYWLPIAGHSISFIYDPLKVVTQASSRSVHGIFALYLGGATHNIISNPGLVKDVMAQKESVVSFPPAAWYVMRKLFCIPARSKAKYFENWKELNSYSGSSVRGTLDIIAKGVVQRLEDNIPQMISFIDTEIDLQPWEREAKTSYISDSEAEIDLMELMRYMMGHALIPAIFGSGIMEKHANLLHDVFDMDNALFYLLIGLPALTPWPGIMKAHLARNRLLQCMDDFQYALDAIVDDKPVDPLWGDLDDVSEFIIRRHRVFKDHNFDVKERGDIMVLWALVANSSLLVFWQILYILSTPRLLDRIRLEIDPYTKVSKPLSIGTISEAPKLTISGEDLSKNCPLLKATYIEALRLTDQAWSMRRITEDVIVSDKEHDNSTSFILHKGEYVTVPHSIHMRDPRFFKYPEKFEPERFLIGKEDGTSTVDMKTIRSFSSGSSVYPGRILAEEECLSLVAGVLAFWDIQPADEREGWVIPKMQGTGFVAKPMHEMRVRIKRKRFPWGK